jgi:hypothetical protein
LVHATQDAYLAFCAIFRDEARYLREWIEFHRLVGGERFYLYNNLSEDDYEEVLAPYVSAGLVELRDWPLFPGQGAAYGDCLERHREDSRWIAFIDMDEFLFSPELRPLPEILRDYEAFPGVGVNRLTYGTSGHALPPTGPVIEGHTRRTASFGDTSIKSVVDPRRALRCVDGGRHPHAFDYRDGFAVDEHMRPIDREPLGESEPHSVLRLRINHYFMKSEQEWRQKLQVPMPHTGEPRDFSARHFQEVDARCSAVTDETILAYVPALRRALAALPEPV